MPTVSVAGPGPDWIRGSATITVTGSTAGPSGVASVTCDGQPTSGATATLTFSTTGEHRGACQSTSRAGLSSVPAAYDVRIDNTPPSGTWRPVQFASDPRHIVVSVSDGQAGVAGGQISLRYPDGSVHGIPTTFDAAAGTLSGFVDDDSLAAGTYQATATVRDGAGNEATVTTQSDGSPLYVPVPLRTPTAVLVSGTSRDQRLCRVRSVATVRPNRHTHRRQPAPPGRRLRICATVETPAGTRDLRLGARQSGSVSGVVESATGQPLAGQTLQVTDEPIGYGPQPAGTVVSDVAGRFVYAVPPGPSRRITFSFPGTHTLHDAVATASVAVTGSGSLAVPRLVRSGGLVRISGRVDGVVPTGGALVQLEYFLPHRSNEWAPFGKPVTTAPNGRWSTTVRISRRTAGLVYRLRALIPAQTGWPYLAATTPVAIRRVAR